MMNEKNELVELINSEFSIDLSSKIGMEELRDQLIAHIHALISGDFQKLVSILYRVDVNEARLKSMLKDQPGQDAGIIIADLIIERQLQKIKSRRDYKRDQKQGDEEKW